MRPRPVVARLARPGLALTPAPATLALATLTLATLALAACAPEPEPAWLVASMPAERKAWAAHEVAVRARARAAVVQGCGECHEREAAEWASSRHRLAFDGRPFREALGREPREVRPFCRGCHAPELAALALSPEARPWAVDAEARDELTPLTSLGVTCLSCHSPHDAEVAETGAPMGAGLRAMAGVDAVCATCHEFAFSDGRGTMQRTVSEHLTSGAREGCVSCHMPLVDDEDGWSGAPPAAGHEAERPARPRRRSHTLRGGHDEALVRGALRVTTRRIGPGARVELSPQGVGHALPTGDLFRRLTLELAVVRADGTLGTPARVSLGRSFRPGREGEGHTVEVADTRLEPGVSRVVELASRDDGASAAPLRLRVSLERVSHYDALGRAVVESALVLDERTLPPSSSP